MRRVITNKRLSVNDTNTSLTMLFSKNQTYSAFIGLFVLVCLGLSPSGAQAQGQQKAIIFTGIVVAGKSTERLPGAYIFIPKAGKGALTSKSCV